MEIASHNTMSYLTPAKWYMRPFHFIGRCQDLTLEQQLKKGVRVFDIRITFDKSYTPRFAHGRMMFKSKNVEHYLRIINTFGNCSVRIILETPHNNDIDDIHMNLFTCLVMKWIGIFKNIKFFEGTRKYDWWQVVNINQLHPTPKYIQKISSMTGSILDDWFPRLYAMFNNRKNIDKYVKDNPSNKDGYIFIDFIGKYY